MEIGLRYNKAPVCKLDIAKPAISGFDLFSQTERLCSSLFENKVEKLNKTAFDLTDLPSLVQTGLNKLNQSNDNQMSIRSIAEASLIIDFLKTIPIYEEVLSYKQNEKVSSSDSNSVLDKLQEKDRFSSHENLVANIKKSGCANELYNGMTNASTVGYPSSNTVSTNSHPDNSYPFIDSCMHNELDFTNGRFIAESYAYYANTSLKLNGVNQQLSNIQGQFYSPDLTQYYVPSGYIKIDSDNNLQRKSKVITNCEHTDRKHYAKGLCSTCYHKGGRTKLAWGCPHKDKVHYAKGYCQECYIVYKRFRKQRAKLMNTQGSRQSELLQFDGF